MKDGKERKICDFFQNFCQKKIENWINSLFSVCQKCKKWSQKHQFKHNDK